MILHKICTKIVYYYFKMKNKIINVILTFFLKAIYIVLWCVDKGDFLPSFILFFIYLFIFKLWFWSTSVSAIWTRLQHCVKYLDFKPNMRFEVFCVLNHVIYNTVLLLQHMCKKHFDVISLCPSGYILCNRGESIMQKVYLHFDNTQL